MNVCVVYLIILTIFSFRLCLPFSSLLVLDPDDHPPHSHPISLMASIFSFRLLPPPKIKITTNAGTCVNVGCIPKKLFHRAGILREDLQDAHHYGWRPSLASESDEHSPPNPARIADLARLDWPALRLRVHEQIRSLNFGYRKRLRDDGVAYLNARGSFGSDSRTVVARFADGTERRLTARHVAIAVGNRPKPLGVPGEELAISSDDVFGLENPPGKTWVERVNVLFGHGCVLCGRTAILMMPVVPV